MFQIPFIVLGVAGLVLGIRAARVVHGHIRSAGLAFWRVQGLPLAAGLLLAGIFAGVPYPIAEGARVQGFPIPGAAFEKHDGRWMDFVGVMTMPALFADAAFGLLLPQIILAWRIKRQGRSMEVE